MTPLIGGERRTFPTSFSTQCYEFLISALPRKSGFSSRAEGFNNVHTQMRQILMLPPLSPQVARLWRAALNYHLASTVVR